jgi:hypothetical protein
VTTKDPKVSQAIGSAREQLKDIERQLREHGPELGRLFELTADECRAAVALAQSKPEEKISIKLEMTPREWAAYCLAIMYAAVNVTLIEVGGQTGSLDADRN